MTPEDREFIVRALAVHAALVVLGDADPSDENLARVLEVYTKGIRDYANVTPPTPPGAVIRTIDGREFRARFK